MVMMFVMVAGMRMKEVTGRAFLLDDGYSPDEYEAGVISSYPNYSNQQQYSDIDRNDRTLSYSPYGPYNAYSTEEIRAPRQDSPYRRTRPMPYDTVAVEPAQEEQEDIDEVERGMGQIGTFRRLPGVQVEEVRVRRDSPYKAPLYAEAKSDHYKHHGHVGPVYTFVKTDHHANFKWGVRHTVGHKHH